MIVCVPVFVISIVNVTSSPVFVYPSPSLSLTSATFFTSIELVLLSGVSTGFSNVSVMIISPTETLVSGFTIVAVTVTWLDKRSPASISA